MAKRVAKLERDNTKLTRKLKQAETIIEVQKNIGNSRNFSARKQRGELINAVADLGLHTNTKATCAALGVPRARYYPQAASQAAIVPTIRPAPPLALSVKEE